MKNWHGVALIVIGGLLHLGFFLHANAECLTYVDDFVIISSYLHNFSQSLYEGNLYPRWMGELFSGAGAPAFVYYSPLAYYICTLFKLPASIDPDSILQLALSLSAGITCASLAAYCWLKQHATIATATFIAFFLMLLPSQFVSLNMDLSLAQIWASVWFPLALLCLERWHTQDDKRYLIGFTLVLFLIFMTHVPSAILFWPVLALFGCRWPLEKKNLYSLVLSFMLAVGLACIYIIPVLANWHFIGMEHYIHFIEDYKTLFISPYELLLFFIPQILLMATPFIVMAICAAWLNRKNDSQNEIKKWMWIAAIIVLLLSPMFTASSTWLWENFFLLHLLQAPFRLLTLYFVLSPLLLLAMQKKLSRKTFILIIFVMMIPTWWFTIGEYKLRRDASHITTAQNMLATGFETKNAAEEYKTIWMPKVTTPLYYKNLARLPQAELSKGNGSVRVTHWSNEIITLHVSAPKATTLRLKQLFFPAWQARINGHLLNIHIDKVGLMLIDVPAGDNDVIITFSALAGEAPGAILSLISLLLLAVWSWATEWRYSKRHVAYRA